MHFTYQLWEYIAALSAVCYQKRSNLSSSKKAQESLQPEQKSHPRKLDALIEGALLATVMDNRFKSNANIKLSPGEWSTECPGSLSHFAPGLVTLSHAESRAPTLGRRV